MQAVEILRQAQHTDFVDKKGRSRRLSLLPGLTDKQIAQVEEKIAISLPPELQELMQLTRGFAAFDDDDVIDHVDFSGNFLFGWEGFPHGLPVAKDECGNHWVVDLTREDPRDTSIFYACHDPPVIIYQARSITEFLSELLRRYQHPWTSSIDYVHDECDMKIWQTNPWTTTRQQAVAGDSDLREFAESLDEHYRFIDMRTAEPGKGLSLDEDGTDIVCKRFGEKRIFACKFHPKPATKPNWFQKLFG